MGVDSPPMEERKGDTEEKKEETEEKSSLYHFARPVEAALRDESP